MWYDSLLEKNILPDALVRFGIRRLLAEREQQETAPTPDAQKKRLEDFIALLRSSPIAINTADANTQHYEVPSEYYLATLGPRLKYSSCLYDTGARDLPSAEIAMLELTCRRAGIADGQRILDLGCGWGSFSLYAAEKFPAAQITGVSNSRTQKEFIDSTAKQRGLTNLRIVTCDINDFAPAGTFDRIVSVEMLEHVRNAEKLFARIATWLADDTARLFVHIFCHRTFAYPFETDGDNDWMARHFFTGGIMPSAGLYSHFNRHLAIEQQWTVNGTNYERTCNHWLANMDAHRPQLFPLFEKTYGADQALKWWTRWRIFHMACAELFGWRGGTHWHVSHYLFKRAPLRS